MRSRIFGPALLAAVFLFTYTTGARASTVDVYPTDTPQDIQNVQAAIASAQPGDTILLHAGTFDWSGNTAVFSPFVVPFGVPITTPDITITGETDSSGNPLTSIIGPVDSTGYPQGYLNGGNVAFVNGPGVTGVTIEHLSFKNFETAIVLIQDSVAFFSSYYAQNADFSNGADDYTIQNCRFLNVRMGIEASGANDRLTIQNNYIQALKKNGLSIDISGTLLANATGIGVFVFAPQTAPTGVVIQNNTVVGSGPDFETLTLDDGSSLAVLTMGIGAQGITNLLVQGNTVQNFTIGISVAAVGNVSVLQNSSTNTQTGLRVLDGAIVANGGEPDSSTTDALIKNNDLTGNVLLPTPPTIGSQSAPLLQCGCGILTNADKNRYVGNHVSNNAVAGIMLYGDATTAADLTATGNIILGNSNLVAGSSYALSNNSISGSHVSTVTVGQAVSQLTQSGTKRVF